MATIEKLICNLKDEVSKWFYQKGEVDGKLDEKAGTSVASSSGNGLMSSADKVKLDGITTGANKTTVDSAMSSTSTNPVQNKVINAALNGKANSNHTHNSLSPVILGTNVDFNNYKTEGTYVISWDSVQSATNAPNKTGGRLEVISVQNGVKQIYHNYGASESGLRIWWRNYYPTTDTWFGWRQIIDTYNVDTALSSTSTNPVQNKVVKAQLDSLNSTKANTNHTHGVAKQTSTIADNTFITQLGNLAIFSWWTGYINISSTNTWTDVWTLPVTNKGKTVWSSNIYNGVDLCYFRVGENSNKVQARANKTGSIPIHSGELIFFIE